MQVNGKEFDYDEIVNYNDELKFKIVHNRTLEYSSATIYGSTTFTINALF